jgi:hypothetical protein
LRLRSAVVLLALSLQSCGKERMIDVNQRIHHDDFEYTVLSFAAKKSIGPAGREATTPGVFYVVTFRVENRARRVKHHWADDIAYIIDRDGVRYGNNPEARALLYEQLARPLQRVFDTPAGRTDTTLLVFELPGTVHDPCLGVNGDFLMGDLLDGNAFAAARVKLY